MLILQLLENVGLVRHHCIRPQHLLYFFPLPQGQGSLRLSLGVVCAAIAALSVSKNTRLRVWSSVTLIVLSPFCLT